MPDNAAVLSPVLLRKRRLSRMRSVSRTLMWFCPALSVVLVVGMLVSWIAPPAAVLLAQADVPVGTAANIDMTARIFGFLISMIPLSMLIVGLEEARRCFARLAKSEVFSGAIAKGFGRFALCLLGSALAQPLAATAMSLLLSWNALPGLRAIVFRLDSGTMLAVLFASVLFVLSWVLSEGVAIEDENAQFI